ncbi:MAG: transposase [Methylobacter sp.]|nr:transposase [Methylobacter sp.]
MLTLPIELMNVITVFAPLFTKPAREHVKLLIAGAILSPGKRTMTSAWRVMGRGQKKDFQRFHRVLNRAVWSTLKASRLVLGLLVSCFVPEGPVVVGVDDTLERRRGGRRAAKGIDRDPVCSSKGYFVKASGLRWLCGMVLTEISGAGCARALPILTVLCPSERFYQQKGRSHQTLLDRAWRDRTADQL